MKDIYIKFGSAVVGDSTDSTHVGQVEATSFNHVVRQPRSATSSTRWPARRGTARLPRGPSRRRSRRRHVRRRSS